MRTLIESIIIVVILGYVLDYGSNIYHRDPYVMKCKQESSLCGVWGYSESAWLVSPLYDHIYIYHPNMISIKQNKKFGLANLKNKIILEIEFDSIGRKARTGVVAKVSKNGNTGIINYKGEWLVKPIYPESEVSLLGNFDEYSKEMTVYIGTKSRSINKQGDFVGVRGW